MKNTGISEEQNVPNKSVADVAPGDVVNADMGPFIENDRKNWQIIKKIKLSQISIDELGKISIDQSSDNTSDNTSNNTSGDKIGNETEESKKHNAVITFFRELNKMGELDQLTNMNSTQIKSIVKAIGDLIKNSENNLKQEEMNILYEALQLFEDAETTIDGVVAKEVNLNRISKEDAEIVKKTIEDIQNKQPEYDITTEYLLDALKKYHEDRGHNFEVTPNIEGVLKHFAHVANLNKEIQPKSELPGDERLGGWGGNAPNPVNPKPESPVEQPVDQPDANPKDMTIQEILKNNIEVPPDYTSIMDRIKSMGKKLLNYKNISAEQFDIINHPFIAKVLKINPKNKELTVKILIPTGRDSSNIKYDDKTGPELNIPFNAVKKIIPAKKAQGLLGRMGSWLTK